MSGPSRAVVGIVALATLNGAHVNWPDSKGLNEWGCKALELTEERSQLGWLACEGIPISTASGPA